MNNYIPIIYSIYQNINSILFPSFLIADEMIIVHLGIVLNVSILQIYFMID